MPAPTPPLPTNRTNASPVTDTTGLEAGDWNRLAELVNAGVLTQAEADVRYALGADARLTNQRVPVDASVTDAKVAPTAAISLDKTADSATRVALTAAERTKLAGVATGATNLAIGTTGTTAAAGNDGRLDNQRVPVDGSVTNAKVAAGAAIALDKTVDSAARLAMTAAERTKLTGVATGATANATDAQLRDRSTHTGTQLAATISDFNAAVAAAGGAGATDAGTAAFISGTGPSNQAVKDIRDLVLARDTFTRANGAIGTSSSGRAWTTVAGAPTVTANQLTGAYDVLWPSIGTDVDVSVALTLPNPVPASGSVGIMISAATAATTDNMIYAHAQQSGLPLNQLSGGGFTGLAPNGGFAPVPTPGAHILRVRRLGAVVTMFWDGTQVGQVTLSAGAVAALTGGGVGLRNSMAGAIVDDVVASTARAETAGTTNTLVATFVTEAGATRAAVISAANSDGVPFAVVAPLALNLVNGVQTLSGGGAGSTTATARKWKTDGDQVLATFAETVITLLGEDLTQAGTVFEAGGAAGTPAANGIKVKKAGLYLLEVTGQWASGNSGPGPGVRFYKNGANFNVGAGGTMIRRFGVSNTTRTCVAPLAVDDVLVLQSNVESAATLTGTGIGQTGFSITYLGTVG